MTKNWRPISLINLDAKIASKVLALRMQKVLASIINYDQTVTYEADILVNRFDLLVIYLTLLRKTPLVESYSQLILRKLSTPLNIHFYLLYLNHLGSVPNLFIGSEQYSKMQKAV